MNCRVASPENIPFILTATELNSGLRAPVKGMHMRIVLFQP